MSGLSTFGVTLLQAVLGCVGAGLAATVAANWLRVSSFEGEAGYFVVFLALLGFFGGGVVGFVSARVVAKGPSPTFLHALGVSSATTVGLLALYLAFTWLAADFPPKLEGKELAVEVEIRLPDGASIPSPDEPRGFAWYATVAPHYGKRRTSSADLDLRKARKVDGRWIVPAAIYLHTSQEGKSFGVALADPQKTQFFHLRFPGRPGRRQMEWSAWQTEPHWGDLSPVPPEKALAFRWRVQFYVEPPDAGPAGR